MHSKCEASRLKFVPEDDSGSRCDVIDVIAFQLPKPRVYFDFNSNFINCDCEEYFDAAVMTRRMMRCMFPETMLVCTYLAFA